jgi:hypothetical protein
MSLNFDEYDTDVPEKTIVVSPSKIAGAVQAAPNADKSIIAGSGINPQSSSGLGIDPRTINAVWNDVKPYVDPRHYNDNTSTDYQNIDFPTSIAHGVADVMGAYGIAKGLNYGAGQLFPNPGIAVQRNQLKLQKAEAKRIARGDLNPIELADLAYKQAKTQQILAGLNPNPVTPPTPNINPQAQTGLGLNAPVQAPPQTPPQVAPQAAIQAAVPTQTLPPAPVTPSVQQRNILGGVTDQMQTAAENIKLRPTELPGHVLGKYGTVPMNVKDLMIFANQASPEMKADFTSEFIDILNKGLIPKPATEAGVTPSTSQPEAQTLVTEHQASLTPNEKQNSAILERANILLDDSLSHEEKMKQYDELKNQHISQGLISDEKLSTTPEPTGTPTADLEVKQITPETEVAPEQTKQITTEPTKQIETPPAKESMGEPSKEVKGAVKAKKQKAPEPFEGFKKLPGEERWAHTAFGAHENPQRSHELVDALKHTLPEGTQLKFPTTEKGVSKGGMPSSKDVLAFTNQHLGTEMKLDENGRFPSDFKYTEENLKKMHSSVLDQLAKAKTPSEISKAEKGFATLGMLAGMIGIPLAGLGLYNAYKEGKQTGDYTNLGMGAVDLASGLAGKAAVPLGFLTHMSGLGKNEKEELARIRAQSETGKLGSPFRSTVNRAVAPPAR